MAVLASEDQLAINTIRTLAIDAVERANSGHPGTAMALAPLAYVLWTGFLRYDPDVPNWPNRDRFVLSIGHASVLLYAVLYLAEVKDAERDTVAVSLDDLKRFRQLDSRTPGHPEYHYTTGVETTTGPLGQGCSNSVGMALAARQLAERYNRPGETLFDHDIYVLCGDGDMMEGVTSEAASLAGHLGLSNLCWIYDSNLISIEGSTEQTFTEDVCMRFKSYGWHVKRIYDANDLAMIASALQDFRKNVTKPTLIILMSVIGWGSPKAGSEKAHGEALGTAAVAETKRFLEWPAYPDFYVPPNVQKSFSSAVTARGRPLREAWQTTLEKMITTDLTLKEELDQLLNGNLPHGWDANYPRFESDAKGLATRDAGGEALNAFAAQIPWLCGGAADLSPSTKTKLNFPDAGSLSRHTPSGRNIHFGVREHAMGSIANGMALSFLRPFTATFLVFSDYMRPCLRLAALMGLPVIFVFTHDSIGVGEDGPTHQPIEHLASLRAIPGLDTIRPGDANETVAAWHIALSKKDRPTALLLSRQALPTIDRIRFAAAENVSKGAYILEDCRSGEPEIILIGTGSEVSLVILAHDILSSEGIRSRVVSMPSWTLFEAQNSEYKEQVFPPSVQRRVVVEKGIAMGWERYIGAHGRAICMKSFGVSAPLPDLQILFGFTVKNICETARALLEQKS